MNTCGICRCTSHQDIQINKARCLSHESSFSAIDIGLFGLDGLWHEYSRLFDVYRIRDHSANVCLLALILLNYDRPALQPYIANVKK